MRTNEAMNLSMNSICLQWQHCTRWHAFSFFCPAKEHNRNKDFSDCNKIIRVKTNGEYYIIHLGFIIHNYFDYSIIFQPFVI